MNFGICFCLFCEAKETPLSLFSRKKLFLLPKSFETLRTEQRRDAPPKRDLKLKYNVGDAGDELREREAGALLRGLPENVREFPRVVRFELLHEHVVPQTREEVHDTRWRPDGDGDGWGIDIWLRDDVRVRD